MMLFHRLNPQRSAHAVQFDSPHQSHATEHAHAHEQEWVRWNGTALAPIWDQLKAAELYDHEGDDQAWTDADKFENVNVVKTTDPTVVAALSKKLHAAFGFPDPEQE